MYGRRCEGGLTAYNSGAMKCPMRFSRRSSFRLPGRRDWVISMAMMSGSERMSMACMTARYLMHWKTPRLRTVPLMGIGNSGSRLSRNTVPGTAARRIRLEGKRSTQRAERVKAQGIPARRGETAQRARQGRPAAKRRAQGTPTKDGLPVRAGRQLNSPNELRANGLVEESA